MRTKRTHGQNIQLPNQINSIQVFIQMITDTK